jgi:hypothetical protein
VSANTGAPPLDEVTANGPATPVIAPVAPARDIAKCAGDAEPIEITPEVHERPDQLHPGQEKEALSTLISQAALADGFKGKGYVRAWLQKHYQIAVSDVAEIPGEIRARVRAHALSVLERGEQGSPKMPVPTTTQ